MRKRTVFISYSSKDKSFAKRLAADLQTHQVGVWFDQWEIKVGDSITQKINEGIHDNDYLAVVLSPNSVASPWVKKELNAAMMKELDRRSVVVLPILYQDCEIPSLIADKHYADFRSDYRHGLNKLLQVLAPHGPVRKEPKLPPRPKEKKPEKEMAPVSYFWRILPEAEIPEQVPTRRAVQARRPRAAAEAKGKVLVALAIVIPLIVALFVGVVYLQWGKTREKEARFTELVTQAQARHALALTASDNPAARGFLHEAQRLIEEAGKLKPEDPVVDGLQGEIEATLDKINNVVKLYWTEALQRYDDVGSNPSRVIVSGFDVYVLDRGTDRVYKYLLNELKDGLQEMHVDPVLLRKGEQRGDIMVGDLVDMVWMPAGGGRQTSNLLVLESGGSLLEYDPVLGLTVLPMSDKDKWRYPQLIGSYFGNFYQVFKYAPTADGGYSDQPTPWLQIGVDLAGVVDMAIDGYIYLLYADGKILKFADGELEPFEQTGLDEPLRGPTAIFTRPDEEAKSLWVADAGNGRIVQFSKEGRFIHQLRAAEAGVFDQLKSIYVDEIGSKFYILSGNTLYMANIPEGEGTSEPSK